MFPTRQPARQAIAMPSPVEVSGLRRVAVDLADAAGGEHHRAGGQRLDAPCVHVERVDAVAARRARRGWRCRDVIRSIAIQRSRMRDVRVAPGAGQERLVDGPAGRVGRVGDAPTAWPPSRVRCEPERTVRVRGERHALRPRATAIASALCSAMNAAACSSTSPAPASCVSRTCSSTLSSSPSTPTMPPWAQAVAASSKLRLASRMIGCRSARCRATVRPPRPAPAMTTGSVAASAATGRGAADVAVLIAGFYAPAALYGVAGVWPVETATSRLEGSLGSRRFCS